MTLRGRDVLTLGELTPAEVRQILDTAKRMKADRAAGKPDQHILAGKSVAVIFMKPSMRTRVSFEVGCIRLGAHPVILGADSAFSRNESVYDTTKVLERYVDAIVIRTFEQSQVEEIAAAASVPVINALTDDYHPCQVLADLLTIDEHKGHLEGLTLAYVGDGNNMLNTLMIGGALTGMNIRGAVPEGYDPLPSAVEAARRISADTGSSIEIMRDPAEAVAGADVIVTDTWASMGQEAEHAARLAVFAPYCVTPELMGCADGGALFMHCLPAHRGEEVVDAVIDAPCSIVFDEAENRLHAQQALLAHVLGD